MAQLSIHVDRLAADDWIVREKCGRELGHYPSQREAEDVGRLVARKRKAVLLVNGRADAKDEPQGWFARIFRG